MKHSVELSAAVPSEFLSDFSNKLHFVSESLASFRIADSRDRVEFDTQPGREAEVSKIASRVREVAEKMSNGHRGFHANVLASKRPTEIVFNENPRKTLEADGNLFEYGPGRFGLGPLCVRLIEYFEQGVLRIADRFGAARFQFPALMGADVLHRCRYIQSFPHCLTLTAHLREDLEAIQRFGREVSYADGGLQYPSNSVAAPKCLLTPAICFHYYAWLAGQRLTNPHTITSLGHCFRYESGGMSTLERLWDFTMREIVFVGTHEFTLERRQQCIEWTTELLDEWGLTYEIRSATDPFFIEGYSTQTNFQSAFELKFEIRADLPYSPGKTLAIGSFNFHQDFFGRAFNIISPEDKPACTSCVGYGMERIVWAFVSQHGPNPKAWPARIRKAALGE
jgi:seryl-tRNA synthetase